VASLTGWRPATGLVAVLAVAGGRYGFHRDELYFVAAGRHPAFGYPDVPPLVPLLATGWHDLVGGSLWAFRLLPAVLAGLVVLVTAATSRALGGTTRDVEATAFVVALCSTIVAVGHLFSTTTFDLLATSTLIWLLVRALAAAGGEPATELRRWLLTGSVAGLALQIKTLPALVLACCAVGLLVAGPREPLRRPGPWLAAALAAGIAAPNLLWQNAHGWPQLEVSAAIAEGGSATSVGRWLVVPLQATLTGPVLAVPLVAGLVVLLRSPAARPHRWLAVAYLALLLLVVVTGGKPYYTVGLLPALLAAGMPGVLGWLDRRRWRWRAAAGLLVLHVLISAVLVLPVLPPRALAASGVLAVNPDAGEMVGWPDLIAQVSGVAGTLPAADAASMVILTTNYGEAGALARARRLADPEGAALPPVYSGHDAFGLWGPPPASATRVLVVGDAGDARLAAWFTGCRVAGRIDNGVGLDNEEQGVPIRLCTGLVRPWSQLWPGIVRLG
jgi:4-amino-4-deoxy-L-arabinose transferase-like glycosyltransferase